MGIFGLHICSIQHPLIEQLVFLEELCDYASNYILILYCCSILLLIEFLYPKVGFKFCLPNLS